MQAIAFGKTTAPEARPQVEERCCLDDTRCGDFFSRTGPAIDRAYRQ
jgi:hypothetical protein